MMPRSAPVSSFLFFFQSLFSGPNLFHNGKDICNYNTFSSTTTSRYKYFLSSIWRMLSAERSFRTQESKKVPAVSYFRFAELGLMCGRVHRDDKIHFWHKGPSHKCQKHPVVL